MTGTKIMGVSVPVVTKGDSPIKSSFTRGYSVTGVSSRVDETADKFERILDVIIEYADIETRLKRLGEEINKTNRRVNALEQVTMPALREQVGYISQTLDERAREDLFRLKKVKKKIEKKKKAATALERAAFSRRESTQQPQASPAAVLLSGRRTGVAATMIASTSRRISMLPRACRRSWLPSVRILMTSRIVSSPKCSSSHSCVRDVGPQLAEDPLEFLDLVVVELAPRRAKPVSDAAGWHARPLWPA